jgi:signal transduction histidine kinase/CheY-like chemotaxis protein
MDVALEEERVMSETRKGKGPRESAEGQDRGQTPESVRSIDKAPKRRRRGLARRLAWAFVSMAVGLLLVMGLVLTFVSYNAQVEQIIVRQQKTADGAALLTSRYLTRARDTLEIYGQAASGYGLLLRPLETQVSELEAMRTGHGEMFQQIILVDDEGMEQAKVPHSEGYGLEDLGSQADSLAYQRALEGEVFVDTQTQMPSGAMFPVLLMAAPIPARAGSERRGVLMAEVSLKGMADAVAQVEVGETGYAYIVDPDTGELRAHSDSVRSEELGGTSVADVPIVAQITRDEQDIQHQYEGLADEPVIGAASPLPQPNWTLVVELPTSEGLASVRQMLYLLVVLIVVGAVVAGSLGLLIPQRIVQPVLTLQQGAQEIGAGELDRVIHVETGDEIQDLAEAFNQMAANLKASQTELEQWGRELETKVEARTRELADASSKMQRRAIQLEASAEVARAIASVRDLDVLLGQVTRFISERFGWYHVGVFLLDRSEEYAVLQAASSEGGQRMLARGHRLKVGESGIVGFVTGTRQPRIALDVGQDAVFFDNPDLPRTRSEMALPLAVGGRVIGALDVQSTEPAAYDEEDVALLRILADQVAIAIENVRLFERTQQALREVEAIHRQYIEREWAKETAQRHDLAYEYRRRGVPPLDDAWTPELSEALSGGEVVATRADDPSWGDGHAKAALAAPIKYRDQVIGVLDLQETAESRQWTEDEITLVQAISDQVGLALENARLFADTQRRAEELAAINRIGLSVNSDLDLTGVLSALYQELRSILDVESFYVALYDANSEMLEFPLMIGEEGPIELRPQYMDESPGVTGYIIQSGQALHLRDLQAIPEDAPYQVIDVDEEPTRSYVGVPLVSRDRVIGVLSVQSSQPGAYSEEDVELLMTVATQASTAIENARAYERLTETAEELREIDRFKTQFLANMSHELRTPLNSIIGFSRVMLKGIDGPLTESQETDLNSIHNSGQHLLALINSILDMSKIEAGKMELSFEEVRLPDVLSAVLGTTNALVKDKPVELHSYIPDDLPTVWADTQRVRQVLLNLMSNAAKFTEEGYISVRAEAGDEFVTITVEDTGVGIEPDAQTRLFIPFQQVDGSTTRRAGGTGLGLAISRSFVEMLGGEIWVESEPGKGSTFGFTLPIYQVLHQKQEQVAEFQLDPDKKAILAIDDDPGVITLLRRYLESDGYQVVGVTEALHAVPAARRLASDLTAITLDVVMPNTDGWQILRTLRQDPQTREIPVVLCSIVEGLDHGLKLGAADCLQKPITRHELLESLRKVERRAVTFD